MYNGMLGGIGQGLQSFATAYQTALNYQLEKAKAASQTAYQQQMADVANKNAATEAAKQSSEAQFQGTQGDVLKQNAATESAKQQSEAEYQKTHGRTEQVEALSKLIGEGGTPAVQGYAPDLLPLQSQGQPVPVRTPEAPPPSKGLINPLPPGLMGPQPSPQMVQDSQDQAAQLQKQPVNPLGPGLMGPPPPPGMLAQSQALQAQKAAMPQQGTNSLPYIPSNLERSQAFSMAEKGFMKDPQTGEVKYLPGPIGDRAKTEDQLKSAEYINAKTNTRSGYGTVASQFKEDAAVVEANKAQTYVAQGLKAYALASKGNTQAQNTLFESAAKAEGLSDTDPKEVLKDGSASQRLKNIASQFVNGTVTQKMLDTLVQDMHESYSSRMGAVQAVKPLYVSRAQQAQADPNLVTATPALDKTLRDSQKIMRSIPAQTQGEPPSLSNGFGLLSGKSTSTPKWPPPGLRFEQFKAWKRANGQ